MSLKQAYAGVVRSDPKRRLNDFYATPPIVPYILERYTNIPHRVVEPCAGRGNISVELKRLGHEVKSYDLFEYENPFVDDIKTGVDALTVIRPNGYTGLITNPPYKENFPKRLLEKAVQEYDYVALFLRLTFLEAMNRKTMFNDHTPSNILIMSDRVRFAEDLEHEPIEAKDQIGGMIAYAWFVWDKDALHDNTRMKWISLGEQYQDWRNHYEETKS